MYGQIEQTRREWLAASLVSLSGASVANRLMAQDPATKPLLIEPLNRFPRMMQEYWHLKVVEAERLSLSRLTALKTKSDAEAHITATRRRVAECFGPFPEKTPLSPRVTRKIDRDTYHIENVLFESRPGFIVSANLYVPKGLPFPRPGVVGSCGHSFNGKAAETYQSFAQGLARQGYVVLTFDPIGQGERFQYLDESTLKSTIGAGVSEHLMCGNAQFLIGEFFGAWRAWDGIRALDYLLSRDEVDPRHIGITGNSGGGTMTMWLCGVEDRWTMAAPSCAVTTFRRNFDNELPTDTEQMPPLALLHGLDHADFLSVMAPKPVIIVAAEKDYFDVRGSIETYERLKRLWKLLGAEENLRLFIGPNEHGYTQPNREAMYQFFNRQTGGSEQTTEPSISIEKDETLWCVPQGQVASIGSQTVMTFTKVRSSELAERRGRCSEDKIRNILDQMIPSRPTVAPDAQILRAAGQRGYPKKGATSYAVETEDRVHAIVTQIEDIRKNSRPTRRNGRVILYVAHHSSDVELRQESLIRELLESEPDSEFFAVDVRGIGDSKPNTCDENSFLTPYGSDYFYAIHSMMGGKAYPLQRAYDILRVIDWLKSFGRSDFHVAALGWGTIPATLAAVVSADVTQVTLKHNLTSWSSIAESDRYLWPLSSFIPNVLSRFDLPDCYLALQGKRLKQIETWGPTGDLPNS